MDLSKFWIYSIIVACSILSVNCNRDVPSSKLKTLVKKSDLFEKIIERQKRQDTNKVVNSTGEDSSVKLVYLVIFQLPAVSLLFINLN